MPVTRLPTGITRSSRLGRALRAILLLGLACASSQGLAQSCTTGSATTLDFGTVSASANSDVQTSITLSCQTGLLPMSITACVFIGEGTPTGVQPRRMSNSNGTFMNYDLFADPARSQIIGTPTSNHATYTVGIEVAPFQTVLTNIPLYGRVYGGQQLPAAFPFLGVPGGSLIRYSYGRFVAPTAEECRAGITGLLGGAGETSFSFSGVQARFPDTCRINAATTMDFGTPSRLDAALDQDSAITLRCPTGTAWSLTLNNGLNADGSVRRMAAGTHRIIYELYRDSARLVRWGDTQASQVSGVGSAVEQSVPVYGRVPAQAVAAPGNYSDTITVTLTY